MIIAVDIGNSAAKLALMDGARVLETARLDTAGASVADLVDSLRVLAGSTEAAPTAIVAVSVVERWTERLEAAAHELDLKLTVVAASHVPISTLLPRPDQTGPDRLIAAWAATAAYGMPVIVVDLGTATTVDAIDGDGFFLGGAILPGLALAARSLAEGTARLPHVELALPAEVIGDETAGALQSGIVIGHVGAVREIVARMRLQLDRPGAARGAFLGPTRVIISGGHASAAWAREAWCRAAGPDLPALGHAIEPDLVLKGLGLLAEHMAGKPRASAGR